MPKAGEFRTNFETGLKLLARICQTLVDQGLSRPVLVGGAAVEYYSTSAIMTGDFDVCTHHQEDFERAALSEGFERSTGQVP